MIEEYRGCFDNYEISNFGNCRKKLKNGDYKSVKGSLLNTGYRYFQTKKQYIKKNHLIHTLVAKHFIGDRPDTYVIDHIDRIRDNNNVNNLRYITQQENVRNSSKFRTDIIPCDRKSRNKIFKAEWRERNREIINKKSREKYANLKDNDKIEFDKRMKERNLKQRKYKTDWERKRRENLKNNELV